MRWPDGEGSGGRSCKERSWKNISFLSTSSSTWVAAARGVKGRTWCHGSRPGEGRVDAQQHVPEILGSGGGRGAAPAIRKKGRRRQHQGGREAPPADASRGGSSGGWGERRQHSLQEEVAAFASYRGDGGMWDSFHEVGSWMNFLRVWGYCARKLTFPDLAKWTFG